MSSCKPLTASRQEHPLSRHALSRPYQLELRRWASCTCMRGVSQVFHRCFHKLSANGRGEIEASLQISGLAMQAVPLSSSVSCRQGPSWPLQGIMSVQAVPRQLWRKEVLR